MSRRDRIDEPDYENERRGGVTPVMWASLAASWIIAAAIILLINPRDPATSVQQTLSLPGVATGVETTGSSAREPEEPNEEIERRWPAAQDAPNENQ